MDEKTKKLVGEALQTLLNSCREGESGAWEPNAEGFVCMGDTVEEIANRLNIKIDAEYK